MDRPAVPAMDEIEDALRDIAEMEEAIRTLKQRVGELPYEMASQLQSAEERVAAARYLYWMQPEVPTPAIGYGLCGLGKNKLVELIGTAQVNIPCTRCKLPLPVRTRSQLQDIRKMMSGKARYFSAHQLLCARCLQEVIDERNAHYEQVRVAQHERLQQLRAMAYRDYLATPEWQERRKRHLRSAGYRCQVCNARDVILDVHHRTYKHLGEEHFTDLLALCRSCHTLFHREGRLAHD